MILQAYTVFDNKALTYQPPWYSHNDGVAMRQLQEAAGDPNTSLSRHPKDFALFHIGSFDDQTGAFTTGDKRHVCEVVALVSSGPALPIDADQVSPNRAARRSAAKRRR